MVVFFDRLVVEVVVMKRYIIIFGRLTVFLYSEALVISCRCIITFKLPGLISQSTVLSQPLPHSFSCHFATTIARSANSIHLYICIRHTIAVITSFRCCMTPHPLLLHHTTTITIPLQSLPHIFLCTKYRDVFFRCWHTERLILHPCQ